METRCKNFWHIITRMDGYSRNAQLIEAAATTEAANLAFDEAGRKAWYKLYKQTHDPVWDQDEQARGTQFRLEKLLKIVPEIQGALGVLANRWNTADTILAEENEFIKYGINMDLGKQF